MLMVCPPKVIAFGLCAIMTQRAGETLYRLRSRNPNRCILTGLFSAKGLVAARKYIKKAINNGWVFCVESIVSHRRAEFSQFSLVI